MKKIIIESTPTKSSLFYELWKSRRCKDYDPPNDLDGGCVIIKDHVKCFLYDPTQGYCPFIHTKN